MSYSGTRNDMGTAKDYSDQNNEVSSNGRCPKFHSRNPQNDSLQVGRTQNDPLGGQNWCQDVYKVLLKESVGNSATLKNAFDSPLAFKRRNCRRKKSYMAATKATPIMRLDLAELVHLNENSGQDVRSLRYVLFMTSS